MENNRDKQTQAIFPIKGKIINAFTTPTKKYFENDEVSSLFQIFGYREYTKKFDPAKFKPSKVIIATDADPDGSHITCLLFGMFLRYLPEVILSGKLYTANPPLYGIPAGKGKMKFFANNKDYVEYVQDIFCKENEICNSKGKKYNKKEITKLLYDNMDYLKFIDHICGIYAIDPELLEFILKNRELPFKKFKAAVEKQFRFVKVEVQNNTTMIYGLVNSKYQTVFFNKRLIDHCAPIIDLLSKAEEYYVVNGKKCTLYDLMMAFSEFEPKNITRYKGLGRHFAPYYGNVVC
jgi:DNA gyrase/topoisomerase IV subunit B